MTSFRIRRIGVLALGTEPQVPMVQEKARPVLLGRDRKLFRDLIHLEPAYGELVASRRTRVLAHGARQRERALLSERLRLLPGGFGYVRFGDDRLHEAGAVAEDQELKLPARAPVVKPTLHGDGLAFVAGELIDIDL